MRRAEVREGLRRLALIIGVTVAAIVSLALVIWLGKGGSFRLDLANVLTIAAAMSMLLGVVAFLGTGGVASQRAPRGATGAPTLRRQPRLRSHEERREREWLAAGLLAFGVLLYLCSLAVR